jgi:hypothetical protein
MVGGDGEGSLAQERIATNELQRAPYFYPTSTLSIGMLK